MDRKTEMISFKVTPQMKEWLIENYGRDTADILRNYLSSLMERPDLDIDPIQEVKDELEELRSLIHTKESILAEIIEKQHPSPQVTDSLQQILKEPKSQETLVNTVSEIIQDYVKHDYWFQDYIDRKIRNTVESMQEFG